ncbi:hypothetical protein Tco_1229206 [Tanacetum coccineum]
MIWVSLPPLTYSGSSNFCANREIGSPLPNVGIQRTSVWMKRSSQSHVSNDFPIDGYDQNDVTRLCARLARLHDLNEVVLVRSSLSSVLLNRK